ncbi:VOC family protein [Paenibacillus mesophilus]|uniref:VOC family protein n=1 Tax=Paenibacillus mesophilus TaxID=2582849 RepID=UPI00110E7CD9|nr:VOC family protein [Paenibacillus mesophilus]TMV45166.1 VOC family protein [Paenibacillus mesophilus]
MSDQAVRPLAGFPATREDARIKSMMVIEVPVADTRRAIEFYVGLLGFYIDLKKNPPSVWDTETEFFISPANGIKIMLQKTDGSERLGFTLQGEPKPFLIMEIEEPAEVVRNRLYANGVRVGEIFDRGGCGTVLTVWDPDGNILKLNYQPK